MNKEIERILEGLKEDYDSIGTCYYPDDILEPKDPKILYDYIIKLQNQIHTLEDELEWYKQECDDLEMRIGLDE